MTGSTFFKDRKIKTQQKIIDDLQIENKQLKEELIKLQNQYDIDKQEILIVQKQKEEYKNLLEQLKEAQREYKELIQEVSVLKTQYDKKMKNFLKEIKKASK